MQALHRCVLSMAVLIVWLSGCGERGGVQSLDPVAGRTATAVRQQGDDANGRQWPLLARITLTILLEKANPKGVTAADIEKTVRDNVWNARAEYSLEGMRQWTVAASNGPPVRLGEVADLDVRLVRRDGQSASPLRASRPETEMDQQTDAGTPARIDVQVETGKVIARGVNLNDVAKAVHDLRPDREYSLEDVRNLTVPAEGGTSVRLGQVAKIDVIIKGM